MGQKLLYAQNEKVELMEQVDQLEKYNGDVMEQLKLTE